MPTTPPSQVALPDRRPRVAPSAWIAPGAVLAGDVVIDPGASVWYGAILRGDGDRIHIGRNSNLQDGVVVHTDPGFPVRVEAGVSVGHRAVLHGCTVERDSLIGIGAVVLNGARIGRGSLVAAGAVVAEGAEVPPGSLVAGVPARVRRALTAEAGAEIRQNAKRYRNLVGEHRQAT